jgi:hypothetical protein
MLIRRWCHPDSNLVLPETLASNLYGLLIIAGVKWFVVGGTQRVGRSQFCQGWLIKCWKFTDLDVNDYAAVLQLEKIVSKLRRPSIAMAGCATASCKNWTLRGRHHNISVDRKGWYFGSPSEFLVASWWYHHHLRQIRRNYQPLQSQKDFYADLSMKSL